MRQNTSLSHTSTWRAHLLIETVYFTSMKTTTCLVLNLLLFSTLLFSSCKKSKDDPAPEIYTEKDPRLILIRDWINKQSSYDLTGIKPEVEYANFEMRDGIGPFKGQEQFTLQMAQSLDTMLVLQRSLVNTQPYITRSIMNRGKWYNNGTWKRIISLDVRPAQGSETFAATAIAKEYMIDVLAGMHVLWSVQYTIPKK